MHTYKGGCLQQLSLEALTHPAVRVGFELATDGIQSRFYDFAN